MGATVGIDVGSVAVKVMVLCGDRPARWLAESTRPDISSQCRDLLSRAVGQDEMTGLCATGYGRNLVEGVDVCVSEIMANAVGTGWLQRRWSEIGDIFGEAPSPAAISDGFRTIVDVGGQDSKVIVFDERGMVRDFAMNDRCAAGTGRFLEVMARVLEVDVARLSDLALMADRPAAITSVCTVFAESEVVSLLSEGVRPMRVGGAGAV